jgi:hypothetical protein
MRQPDATTQVVPHFRMAFAKARTLEMISVMGGHGRYTGLIGTKKAARGSFNSRWLSAERRFSPLRTRMIPDHFSSLVGAAGFEPTTSRTPSECATGLRYAPTLFLMPFVPMIVFQHAPYRS